MQFNISSVIYMSIVCTRISLVCHLYVTRMYPYSIRMSFACHPYVTRISLVCHPYVTRMYSYVIRMSLVCTRMSSVCHSYVLYVTRMSLACTRMSFVCHSYVLVCHPCDTRMCFYHEPQ